MRIDAALTSNLVADFKQFRVEPCIRKAILQRKEVKSGKTRRAPTLHKHTAYDWEEAATLQP
jgi:hypothetical protein